MGRQQTAALIRRCHKLDAEELVEVFFVASACTAAVADIQGRIWSLTEVKRLVAAFFDPLMKGGQGESLGMALADDFHLWVILS